MAVWNATCRAVGPKLVPFAVGAHDPELARTGRGTIRTMSSDSYYTSAAVCRRGHVATSDLNRRAQGEWLQYCTACGAEILSWCPTCGTRIKGHHIVPAVGGKYVPPDFCDFCGAPFPWVGRQGRIYELENRLLAGENVDPAIELELRECLKALATMDPEDLGSEKEVKLWQRIRAASPTLWEKLGVTEHWLSS